MSARLPRELLLHDVEELLQHGLQLLWNVRLPCFGSFFLKLGDPHTAIFRFDRDLLLSRANRRVICAREYQYLGWSRNLMPPYVLFPAVFELLAL